MVTFVMQQPSVGKTVENWAETKKKIKYEAKLFVLLCLSLTCLLAKAYDLFQLRYFALFSYECCFSTLSLINVTRLGYCCLWDDFFPKVAQNRKTLRTILKIITRKKCSGSKQGKFLLDLVEIQQIYHFCGFFANSLSTNPEVQSSRPGRGQTGRPRSQISWFPARRAIPRTTVSPRKRCSCNRLVSSNTKLRRLELKIHPLLGTGADAIN